MTLVSQSNDPLHRSRSQKMSRFPHKFCKLNSVPRITEHREDGFTDLYSASTDNPVQLELSTFTAYLRIAN